MRRFLVFFLAGLIFAADQLSKRWAVDRLSVGREIVIVPRYIELALTTNTGAAFGMFQSATLLLGCIALLAGLGIAVYVVRREKPLALYQAVAFGLTMGGACGNFFDRFRLRFVVDFIDIHLGAYQWPVFNIADSAICVGVVLLAIRYATHSTHDVKPNKNKSAIATPTTEPSVGASE